MAGLMCTCGYLIDYGSVPCPYEWEIVSQKDWFEWNDSGQDGFALQKRMKVLLECPNCGRLWFFRNGFSHPPELYEPTPYDPKS